MWAEWKLLISLEINSIPTVAFNWVSLNWIEALTVVLAHLLLHKLIVHTTKYKDKFVIPGTATEIVPWLIHISHHLPLRFLVWIESIIASLNRSKPLIFIWIISSYYIDIFVIDVDSGMTYSTKIKFRMQVKHVHTFINLEALSTWTVATVTSNNQKSSSLLSVEKCWLLGKVIIINVDLSLGSFEGLVIVDSLLSNFNDFMLMHLNC
jgi:hypothetical protein